MANVMLAARRTTTDALLTVSAITNTLTQSATALSELAATGAEHAAAYRRESVRLLKLDEEDRIIRKQIERATETAEFYDQINERLKANPRLKEHFELCLQRYKIQDESVLKQLAGPSES